MEIVILVCAFINVFGLGFLLGTELGKKGDK